MDKKVICIIPARGGSKRIPRKNIKYFNGKPIISYSIEAAIKSKLFHEVMVSTDDTEIAEIAKSYGASVPFMRSVQNSNDLAGTSEVLLEVFENYKSISKEFYFGCCLYPCAPFVTSDLLAKAFNKMKEDALDAIFPVVKFSNPIQRALKFENEKIKMFNPEFIYTRSQDLEPAYFDTGQFYFFNKEILIKEKKMITGNSSAIVIDEMNAQDIDNEEDWRIAEFKYKLNNIE